MMRRRALIFLFALGTFAGYGSGFFSLAHAHRYGHAEGFCHSWREAEFAPPRPVEAPAVAPAAPQVQAPQVQAPQTPPAPAAAQPGPG